MQLIFYTLLNILIIASNTLNYFQFWLSLDPKSCFLLLAVTELSNFVLFDFSSNRKTLYRRDLIVEESVLNLFQPETHSTR